MSMVAAEPRITPEEFLAMPDRARYELVDGQLVEVNVGLLSSLVGGKVYTALDAFCTQHDLGYVWPADVHVRCFADSGKFRKPDVTFVSRDRLAPDILEEGYLDIPPDLVVEVVSPNDLFNDVDVKVQEYLDAGVPRVWVVNPMLRMVRVHRGDATITGLRETDELSGEEIIPGFFCPVARLFPARPAASPALPAGDTA
jgi:Uma2 family endonuclease